MRVVGSTEDGWRQSSRKIMDSEVPTEDQTTVAEDNHGTEEEIEFVSEGPVRPILDCIDLLSSDDDDPELYVPRRVKDHIDHQKDRVTSTLDRLARHVEIEKQQREKKNKAFKAKVYYQHAHGLQELEFIKDHPGTDAARQCVNQWLKVPGPRPGVVSSSRRPTPGMSQQAHLNTNQITCPIMHCSRKFDNGHLLYGHLKRFDHSPCDPTITLHGPPMNMYACVLCLQQFATMKEYKDHLSKKAKLLDGHEYNIPAQVIQCFACPNCFLLFNLRDECLQHMSAENHFLHAFNLGVEKRITCPIPMPSYAKKVLIALCKDVRFCVLCSSCHNELRSHMDLTAHFRTKCRSAGPISRSENSIAEVAAVFKVKALCPACKQALSNDTHITNHTQRTRHKVKIMTSMEESILAFCFINEGNKPSSDYCLSAAIARAKPCPFKRSLDDNEEPNKSGEKRIKGAENEKNTNGCPIKRELCDDVMTVTAWFCECSKRFAEEPQVEKHIMIANQICHKCMVCGKLADDLSIIHLHMSRFHGGAHLNNYRFWCRKCRVLIASLSDMLIHVTDCHTGHSFYFEQDIVDEEPPAPSTSSVVPCQAILGNTSIANVPANGKWQCQICEDLFDSEETIKEHCKSLNTHQFHKYSCVTCKKHFHKIETLFRHSQQQHNGDVNMNYFCGLCEDVFFEQEPDFTQHYELFHSLDYSFVADEIEPTVKSPEVLAPSLIENEGQMSCGCLQSYLKAVDRERDHSCCLNILFKKGTLWYSCGSCSATSQSLTMARNHLCKNEREHEKRKFAVKCSLCSKSFGDKDAAQQHYHYKHAFLLKPKITNYHETEVFKFTASGACTEKTHVKPACPRGKEYNLIASCSNVEKPANPLEEQRMDIGIVFAGGKDHELPDVDYLRTMTHIIFIDLDNWASFFTRLPDYLNQGTFVWGFQCENNNWKPPINCKIFKNLYNTGSFFLHPQCCNRKDATDFAICMHAGRLDEQLPKHIPFTILSGDKGFLELENQFKKTQRPAHILNPHDIEGEMMCALLNSISDTASDGKKSHKSDTMRRKTKKNDLQQPSVNRTIGAFLTGLQNPPELSVEMSRTHTDPIATSDIYADKTPVSRGNLRRLFKDIQSMVRDEMAVIRTEVTSLHNKSTAFESVTENLQHTQTETTHQVGQLMQQLYRTRQRTLMLDMRLRPG
ncbi:E3 SUMO-protein ligase ZNF451-like [Pelodytes ibericus]